MPSVTQFDPHEPQRTQAISLQRSCKACIRAKRKCDLRKPACGRCVSGRKHCVYQNEPLGPSEDAVKSGASFKKPFHSTASRTFVDGSSLDIIKSTQWRTREILFRNTKLLSNISPPNAAHNWDRATLDYLIIHMKSLPTMYNQYRRTPFIHPWITGLSQDGAVLDRVNNFCPICLSYSHATTCDAHKHNISSLTPQLNRLIHDTNSSANFLERLYAMQALILALTTLLFDEFTTTQTTPNAHIAKFAPYVSVLSHWTSRMWRDAPSSLPKSFTARAAYLYAESVRRTLIISVILIKLYESLDTSFKGNDLIVQTMVFDWRTEFWEVPLEGDELEQWVAEDIGGRCKGPELISYREFTDSWMKSGFSDLNLFEAILLVGCRGKEAVESRIGEDTLEALWSSRG